MNAASATVAVTMGVSTQWGAMSVCVPLERNCTGIRRTVLVSGVTVVMLLFSGRVKLPMVLSERCSAEISKLVL